MNILIFNNCKIPVYAYGGTERVIWDLGRGLTEAGHRVSFLVKKGSHCDFAPVYFYDKKKPIEMQIPHGTDIVHFQSNPGKNFEFPYLVTEHSNHDLKHPMSLNTVFLTRDHANRHGSEEYVYNGLDWRQYGSVDFNKKRKYYHFLGKAARQDKNVKGATDVALTANIKLSVLGGYRLNVSRHWRFTWSRSVKFHGMVGGNRKLDLLNGSLGLIFPVTWHEPFGLAITESLYFGCPVFGTPYGSLPELVPDQCGYLSNKASELASAISEKKFDARECHDFAFKNFGLDQMVRGYLEKYERVIDGEKLNSIPPALKGERNNLPWHV